MMRDGKPPTEAVSVLPYCLLFLDAVSGHRRESPILGESEKRFPIFIPVGFDCPLCAFSGKLPIFASCKHGGVAPLKSPRQVRANLHDLPQTVPNGTYREAFRRPFSMVKSR